MMEVSDLDYGLKGKDVLVTGSTKGLGKAIVRVAAPEEVAYCVAFLASNKADYLTGITIDATGGMLMR